MIHSSLPLSSSFTLPGSRWPLAVPVLVALFAAAFVNTAHGYEEMTIGVGEQRIVTVPVGSDITYTGPLRITRLTRGRITIIGTGPGWGSVTVKHRDEVFQYSVTVVEIPPEQTIARLKSLLSDLSLTYNVAGGKVIVEGRIETAQHLERFNRVVEMFPGIINMVVIATMEPLIDIAVTLVEIDVSSSSGLGLLDIALPTGEGTMTGSFPLSDITSGTVSARDIEVGFSLSSQLLNALYIQIAEGRAKVIANPRIITQNRREAVITSGGEIPYRIVGPTGVQGIEYKPYGIRLTVTPEERANDVLLHVNLESSEPIGAVTGTSENPLTSRSVDMSLAVEKDKTLAIAGLYNTVTSRTTGAGCLFPLFRGGESSRSREIIVLVTPRVTVEGIQQDHYRMVTPKDLKGE